MTEYPISGAMVVVGGFWVFSTCFINAHGFSRRDEYKTCRTMWVISMIAFIATPLFSNYRIVWVEGGNAINQPSFVVVSALVMVVVAVLIMTICNWSERREERKYQARLNEPLEVTLARIHNADYVIESGGSSLVGCIPSLETSEQADQFIEDLLGKDVMRKLKEK